jgi:hypothetical protein
MTAMSTFHFGANPLGALVAVASIVIKRIPFTSNLTSNKNRRLPRAFPVWAAAGISAYYTCKVSSFGKDKDGGFYKTFALL